MLLPVCCVHQVGSFGDDGPELVPVDDPGGGDVLVAHEVGDELDRCAAVGQDRRVGVAQFPRCPRPRDPCFGDYVPELLRTT